MTEGMPPITDDGIDYQEEFDEGIDGVNWDQINEAIAESQEE